MNYSEFKRIVSTFADTPADLDLSKNKLLVQVRDDVIDADLFLREGDVWVRENGIEYSSFRWVTLRLARLDQLADRLKAYVPENSRFVTPHGRLLDQAQGVAAESDKSIVDAVAACATMVAPTHAGFTNISYLTSDAGEGKSTVIGELAIRQANLFKAKETNWLLVPIVLGGRSFLRFDDVIIGAIVEKLRFPYIYYDSFIELVKMGVIVPAFDGFEEMFVESSSGEAISAVGNLISSLSSSGSVLISARRAFFDYMGLKNQAKLFDSLANQNVVFSRLALERWSKNQFVEYAEKCGFTNGSELYKDVSRILGDNHPLLSRAVLVKNLLDLSKNEGDRSELLDRLQGAPDDYFFGFVDTIVRREAYEKWIDRSGTPHKPLITHEEHHLLLSEIAYEMWVSGSDVIKGDVLEVIAEAFCDDRKAPLHVRRQVIERCRQYPLLNTLDTRATSFSFDHEELRNFFLGEYVARLFLKSDAVAIRTLLQRTVLPNPSVQAAVALLRREKKPLDDVLSLSSTILSGESYISYTRESLGSILISVLDGSSHSKVSLEGLTISTDLLISTKLTDLSLKGSYFQSQDLDNTSLVSCTFEECRFERILLHGNTEIKNTVLTDCVIDSIYVEGQESGVFDPPQIIAKLKKRGFIITETKQSQMELTEIPSEIEEDLKLVQRVLRYFLRSTFMPENIIRVRLGQRAQYFSDNVLPRLIKAGIIEEAVYTGSGGQKGYKSGVPMVAIVKALSVAKGRLDTFIQQCQ